MKKTLILLLAAVCLVASADTAYEKYIRKYADIAVAEMQRTGVPASITLAQGLIESGAGLSTLATKGNNHFGIKCHNDWTGARMYHDDDRKGECFRVYKSAEDSFRDHSDFLRYYDRYKSLFDLSPDDYRGWAKGLKKAGYATDPSYASKLIKVIEDYELYKYDSGVVISELPEAPLKVERVEQVKKISAREKYNFSTERLVYEKNKVQFVYAEEGETYASIAAAYHLFVKEILSFNDLKEEVALEPGTMVYIRPKKKYAAKGLEKFIVGEEPVTLRDICQRFAVKMSSIVKLNGLAADYVPAEGDTILLRKPKKVR